MTKKELIKLSRENLRKSKQGSLCECYDEAFIKGYKLSAKRIKELEKEIAELKGEADNILDNWCRGDDPCPHLKKRDEQLTKAKEIIKDLLQVLPKENIKGIYEITEEAEQFLREEDF